MAHMPVRFFSKYWLIDEVEGKIWESLYFIDDKHTYNAGMEWYLWNVIFTRNVINIVQNSAVLFKD